MIATRQMNTMKFPTLMVLVLLMGFSAFVIAQNVTPVRSWSIDDIYFKPDNNHLAKHGLSVGLLWQACKSNGDMGQMVQRALDGRWAVPCLLEGKGYVFIADPNGEGVTVFRNKGKLLSDLYRYIKNSGYEVPESLLP